MAELKNEHALDRARCRGTSLFYVQLLLGCTALNLKRLTTPGETAEGQAAGPSTGRQAPPDADQQPVGAAAASARHDNAHPITAFVSATPTAPTGWTLSV